MQSWCSTFPKQVIAWFIILFLTASGSIRYAKAESEVTLAARLDPTTIPLNQNFSLVIELIWSGQFSDYTFTAPKLPTGEQLRIVSTATSNTSKEENGVVYAEKRFEYRIQPLRQGSVGIPSVSVDYKKTGDESSIQLTTPPLEIEVTSPVVSRSFSIPWWVVIIAGGVVLVGGGTALFLRRRALGMRRKTERAAADPMTQILEKIKELEKLRNMGEYREYTLQLGKLIIDNLYDVCKAPLAKAPITVLRETPPGFISEDMITELGICFDIVDRVKFAGHKPGASELDRLTETTRSFLKLLISKKGELK